MSMASGDGDHRPNQVTPIVNGEVLVELKNKIEEIQRKIQVVQQEMAEIKSHRANESQSVSESQMNCGVEALEESWGYSTDEHSDAMNHHGNCRCLGFEVSDRARHTEWAKEVAFKPKGVILEKILSYLSLEDLKNLQLTSKFWNVRVINSPIWNSREVQINEGTEHAVINTVESFASQQNVMGSESYEENYDDNNDTRNLLEKRLWTCARVSLPLLCTTMTRYTVLWRNLFRLRIDCMSEQVLELDLILLHVDSNKMLLVILKDCQNLRFLDLHPSILFRCTTDIFCDQVMQQRLSQLTHFGLKQPGGPEWNSILQQLTEGVQHQTRIMNKLKSIDWNKLNSFAHYRFGRESLSFMNKTTSFTTLTTLTLVTKLDILAKLPGFPALRHLVLSQVPSDEGDEESLAKDAAVFIAKQPVLTKLSYAVCPNPVSREVLEVIKRKCDRFVTLELQGRYFQMTQRRRSHLLSQPFNFDFLSGARALKYLNFRLTDNSLQVPHPHDREHNLKLQPSVEQIIFYLPKSMRTVHISGLPHGIPGVRITDETIVCKCTKKAHRDKIVAHFEKYLSCLPFCARFHIEGKDSRTSRFIWNWHCP